MYCMEKGTQIIVIDAYITWGIGMAHVVYLYTVANYTTSSGLQRNDNLNVHNYEIVTHEEL